MWTAPSHSHRPRLLSAAATVTATAGTTTAGTATAVVHNRSRSPSVRPAASHSTAAVSCHRSQLLCAVFAGTAAAVVYNRSRSPSMHPAASHSTAAVCCHRPQLLYAIVAATTAAVVPQPPSTLPPSTVAVRHCRRHRHCRCPNPLYRSATSAALGISSKIGKAHLLFCSPPCYKELGGGGGGGGWRGGGVTKTTCTALLLQCFATPPPCDGLSRLARCIITSKSIFPKTREGNAHPFFAFLFY
jgi:hypothetical protein